MSRLSSYAASPPQGTSFNPSGLKHEAAQRQYPSTAALLPAHTHTPFGYSRQLEQQQQQHNHRLEVTDSQDAARYPHSLTQYAQPTPPRLHTMPDNPHASTPMLDQAGRVLPRPLTDFVQVRGIEQFGGSALATHSPMCKGCTICMDKPLAYDQQAPPPPHHVSADNSYRHHVHGAVVRGPFWVSPVNAPAGGSQHPTPPTSGRTPRDSSGPAYPARLPSSSAPYAYPPPVHYAAPAFGAPPGHGAVHVHMMQAPSTYAAPKQPIPRHPAPIGSRRRQEPPNAPRDPEEIERRKRNALASAEFRIRRREREKALRDRCAFLEKRVIELEALLADARGQRGDSTLAAASALPGVLDKRQPSLDK